MDEPFTISKEGTVECTYCHCQAQVSGLAARPKGGPIRVTVISVRCPNPGCQHYGNRSAPRLQVGPCSGGDLVSCPDCGADMEGDEEHDEIWHCPKCNDAYGLDNDLDLERLPGPEDLDDERTHRVFDMRAEAVAEKEGE